MGLGDYTNIDLPGEGKGLLPTPYWREKNLGERWFLGNTYHLSIGQGDLMSTPMQINRMTAAIVSGKKCEPRLVGKGECVGVDLAEENRKIILKGMEKACSPEGTAFPLFGYAGKIYCKTGTQRGKGNYVEAWISVEVPKDSNVDIGCGNYFGRERGRGARLRRR
jgi:penicillin-binding protein 2